MGRMGGVVRNMCIEATMFMGLFLYFDLLLLYCPSSCSLELGLRLFSDGVCRDGEGLGLVSFYECVWEEAGI